MSTDDPQPHAEPRPRPRRRRLWRWLRNAALLLAVLIAAPLTYLSLIGATLQAPDWATARVESALNSRLGGGRIDVRSMQLVFTRQIRPRFQMRNVGVFDRAGTEVAQLNQVSARLSTRGVLRGEVGMRSVAVEGAQITVRRGVDGQFALSFGTGAGTQGTQGDLAGVLDALDAAFATAPLAELEDITAEQLTISLEDARSGRLWQVTDGRIVLRQEATSLDMTISADVFNGTEDLASAVIGFRTEKETARATLTASFENAAAADIAAQSPVLAFLGVLDAPISGSIRTVIGADGELEDLAGALDIAAGALQPAPDTPPIPFEFGKAYVDFDPSAQSIAFSEVSFQSEAASLTAEGTALLEDFERGWPGGLVGQFRVSDMRLQPQGLFAEPMTFDRGAFDFRLRLDPFAVDIGQVSLGPAEQRLLASGRVRTEAAGWAVALDLSLNSMPLDRIVALWPVTMARGARRWVEQNVLAGQVSNLSGAVRLGTERAPTVSMSFQFNEARIQALKFLPPVEAAAGYASLDAQSFTLVAEKGHVTAPQGGDVDIAGSVFRIGDLTADVERAEVLLRTNSAITGALSLLNQAPLSLMDKADQAVDVAEGRAVARATLGFDLVDDLSIDDVSYSVAGELGAVRSGNLIADRVLTAEALTFRADAAGVEIAGPAKVDGLPVTGSWAQRFGPEHRGQSRVEGTIEISQAFLDTFNIALPPGSVSGRGLGQITLELSQDAAPKFAMTSDLNRLGLRLAALNWSKPANRTGALEIAGRLGDVPSIDRLAFSAPGLSARGVIDLTPSGALRTAQFDRVRVGGWLDGPVTLTGRGGNAAPAVAITGGRVDLRTAEIGGGGNTEPGGPLTMRLDRLTVSEGIALTGFVGDFKPGVGLDGQFSAAVNGTAPIRGTVIPTPAGAAIRIISEEAGAALAAAGVLRNARGGRLELTLNPTRTAGVYNGRLNIKNTRIVEAPAMTELLNAISIVGLLDQMNTGGITLSDVDAEFRLSPSQLVLYGSSAVGPSIGVSLDGLYDLAGDRLDMQGVISPVYFLNGIGQIFSRGRDGLFGFNFRLSGAAENPRVNVNPLSILTPGAFREIFRRPPPEPLR